ncbi:MAG: TIGR04552 family protein [Bdellovibrionaceae bacterium]|nr:TIGR04552 family protein [Pseudobdellovibrionaceae bacterium]
MPRPFDFDEKMLTSLVGGRSALDLPGLRLRSEDEAAAFVRAYGFDLDNEDQVEKLWYYHRRALVLLTEKLGFKADEIPEVFRDRRQLLDLRRLLLWASSSHPNERELQRWSCALLRVMHVFVHAENDLFSAFSEEIQKQILSPFQECLVTDGSTGVTSVKSARETGDSIELAGFEVKPFKTSSSTVIKLLAKPDAFAMSVFDKLGVRFVTRNLFDTFRVVRFLVEENLVSFPHVMADQSSNTLYPADLFVEMTQKMAAEGQHLTPEEMEAVFDRALEEKKDQVQFVRKENFFSGEDYRFIKFISRRLVRIPGGLVFFYPFEVQIMDRRAHEKILSGPSHHQAYKDRQRSAARRRLFPDLNDPA